MFRFPTKVRYLRQLMSALGQKRTFAMQNGKSALPPKAGHVQRTAHVRGQKRTLDAEKKDRCHRLRPRNRPP